MTSWTWTLGAIGDWFDADNWASTPPAIAPSPQPGDNATIGAGVAIIDARSIAAPIAPQVTQVALTLGGGTNTGQDVGLRLLGAEITDSTLQVSSGADGWITPVDARILSIGTVTLTQDRIYVEPQRGSLTITLRGEAPGLPGILNLKDGTSGSGADTLIAVAQQSTLTLRGDGIVFNDGFIQVEGFARIGAGTTILGTGVIELENGGHMLVQGGIGSGQSVLMPDGIAALTLADPASFAGHVGFATAGARIELQGIEAHSLRINPLTGELRLYAGADRTGAVLADFTTELVNPNSLDPQGLPKARDFTLATTPEGGTVLTYAPAGPLMLESSLPVPVVATAGSLVAFSDILTQAFGTATPDFHAITLVPTVQSNDPEDFWGQPDVNGIEGVAPQWIVNGNVIDTDTPVTPADSVQLRIGNSIDFPPQFIAQLTPGAGRQGVLETYNIWTVDPQIAAAAGSATPGTANIVNSAHAFAQLYGTIPDSELCNWIADNVAAGAGATMPFPNASIEPEQNAEGGFWRIAYRGSNSTSPPTDWGALVQPGDIVRLQWTTQSGHTTTVLAAVDANDQITVYDNINMIAGEHTIGVHLADYWKATTPFGITIYRLDPNDQYLITGSSRGEVIQGSVHDDLIRPMGGRDSIQVGPGDDVVQGTAAELTGDTILGFGPGDMIDLTDVAPASLVLSYSEGLERLVVRSAGTRVATLHVALDPGESFIVTSDGTGGSLIGVQATDAPLI